MKLEANTPDEYLEILPPERKEAISKIRKVILDNLPEGFEETISYKMLGYVVPHSIYPDGYHCNPELPLPFMNLASQKNFIAVYHMGIYLDDNLMSWFKEEYAKVCIRKLDMGKSCIRFKKLEEIPYDLLGKLAAKMTVENWVNTYESQIKKK